MTLEEIRDKTNSIFKEIFKNVPDELHDETTAADIEDWDSFSHIELVLRVEGEFGVKFALGEMQNLKDVGSFLALVKTKLG
jgi:acyl carrier protein